MSATMWPEEKVERLRKLHADGLSCSQIGMQIGKTRNAVIGKLFRLGIASNVEIVRRRQRKAQRNKGKTMFGLDADGQAGRYERIRQALRSGVSPAAAAKQFGVQPNYIAAVRSTMLDDPWRQDIKDLPPRSETDVARVSFADMEEGKHCKFIPIDPADDFRLDKPMYCGAAPVPGSRYCMHHVVRCHNPPELKIRVRVPFKLKEFA